MGFPPALFVVTFLASLGVFFIGIAFLWWVSIENRKDKRSQGK